MYVSGRVDIFDMVDIDLFTVVALNMMVLKLGYTGESEPIFYNYLRPLTSLDVGLHALACEEDVRCLATLVRSFKLIKLSGTHRVDTQNRVLPTIQSHFSDINLSFVSQQAAASQVIDDVIRQLSFDETELDGEAGFADVARNEVSTEAPIVEDVRTWEFSVEDVVIEDYVSSREDVEQDTTYETEYDVQSNEDAGTYDDDDDDDVEEDFLVDEENEIVEPDVESRVYLYSIESRRNLKLYKNDSVRIRARCEGKVHVFTMSQGTGPTGPYSGMEAGPSGSSGPTTMSKKRKNTSTNDDSQAFPSFLDAHDKWDLCPWVLVNSDIPVKAVQELQRELEVQISMSKAFRAKAKAEREIRGDHVLQYSMLRDYVVELHSTNPNTTVKIAVGRNTDTSLPTMVFQRIYVYLGELKLGFRACRRDLLCLDGAFMKGPFPGQVLVECLGDDIDLHPNSNFTFITDRQKGIILAIKTVYPSAEHRYCLRHIHENMKQGWCGQAYKDLLWRASSATNVRDFEKCRAKSDLLLNNICEVFNGKIVRGRDKPVITLLEYIREYYMKIIVNVQCVIDKCTGPFTPTATRIMESIKKEAHLMMVQWNRENKYQVSGSLGDQCVVDVVSMTCSCRKWELTGIPCKHVVAACWNMALNDRATPPPETWVSRPKKKRKRSKYKDEPFVKDGKLSRKGRTITCQTCENIGHNKATCKGQGRKATTEPAVGQDGSGGLGVGAVIGLSAAVGEGGASDPGGAGGAEISDNGKFLMIDGEEVTSNKLAPMAEEMIMLIEVLKRNFISPFDSYPPVVITKNTSAVIDNRKFMMVDEEDLIFKKISPMAGEILEMLRVCVAKKR
nr:hypothetical protein [Tanacetum cinerariifolium]